MPVECIMIISMSKDRETDEALWEIATRDVKALGTSGRISPDVRRKRIRISSGGSAPIPPALTLPVGGGIDRNTQDRVRKGEMEIEARLDLHGFTINGARIELLRFIGQSYSAHKRCILVITGKGRLGDGAIKREFGIWLEDLSVKPYILSFSQAQPRHGGSGAWYIYLRKNKI